MKQKTTKKYLKQSSPSNGNIDESGFLAGTISCAHYWESTKKELVENSPDRHTCLRWGDSILRAWKNAAKIDVQNRGVVRREEIELEIAQDVFFCAVLTKKPFSQRFTWIYEAFLREENPTKRLRAMIFRSTMPVLWRNLKAPNEDVRLAACSLVMKFFPLTSDDEFIREEYNQRQQQAFSAMLNDDCVSIRVMAVRNIPEHLAKHWDLFPRQLIKCYLEKLVDQLSHDALAEVRAAVYEGFEHLLPCAAALNATQHALKILAKRGTDDKSERVRLAAFKMLNKLHGHRYIKLLDVVTLEDLLLRLDFEQSTQVQAQIVRLLFGPFCPRQVQGIDILERFKRIYFMCKQSRNGSLHFHRLIYTLELVSLKGAVQHIRSLLVGAKQILRKCLGNENNSSMQSGDDTADTLALNMTDSSLILSEQMKLNIAKDILDSAIVLWSVIRYDLFHAQNVKENQEMTKMMSNILHALDPFSTTPLMESALVIASYLPKDRIGRLFTRVKSKLEKEETTTHLYFPHYVEAFAAWDMNKLIEIIEKGLKRLRNEVLMASEPDTVTPQRRRVRQLSSSSSPLPKRAKVSTDDVNDLRRPLELIRMLLASPHTCDQLRENFDIHLRAFYLSLCTIRKEFGALLRMPDGESKFDARTLIRAYETFNIVALLTRLIDEGEDAAANEAELALSVEDRLLYSELKWFAAVLMNERTPSFQIIEMFLRCTNLHMSANSISHAVLNEMANMLVEIRERLENMYDADSARLALQKCAEHLKDALAGCEEREEAERILERKVKPLIQHLKAVEVDEDNTLVEEPEEEDDI